MGKRTIDVERALEQQHIRPEALIEAIHAVNPTGLQLAKGELSRRYALKSRLQSRLLREHFDDLELEAGDEPGVIGLTWRPQARDACHAVVQDLDVDVRARVQLHLDTHEPAEAPRPAARAKTRTAERQAAAQTALDEGRRALEEYDFELARTKFEAALGGDDAAATALLELLVDQLAAWEDAVALEARLDETELTPRVRALLACANAELGRTAECERLSAGLDDPRVIAAWLSLAKRAITEARHDDARALLSRARETAGATPELVALEAELARRRADERKPAEDRLAALLDARSPEAEEEARALLARWPDSAMARRALHQLEAARDAQVAAELVARGQESFDAGDFSRAIDHWAAAQAMGAAGIEAKLEDAARRERDRASLERVGAVVALLRSGTTNQALRAWLALPQKERAAVQAEVRLDVLDWLDELRRDAGPEQADVDAVLALEQARAGATSAEHVAETHAQRLSRLGAGRELLERVDDARERARRQEDESKLRAVRAAIAEERWKDAHLLGTQLLHAEHSLREAARALVDAAVAGRERETRLQSFASALERADLVEALRLVREASRDEGDDRTAWDAQRRALAGRVDREWNVIRSEVEEHAPEFGESIREDAPPGIDPGGQMFYWATAVERHLFLRKTDLRRGRVVATIAMCTPEPMSFPTVRVEGEAVFVAGDAGLLTLSTHFEVLEFFPATCAEHEVLEDILLCPGAHYLWEIVRTAGHGSERARIVDLVRRRVVREFEIEGITIGQVWHEGEPEVTISGFQRPGRRYSASGGVAGEFPIGTNSLAPLPGGFVGAEVNDETPARLDFIGLDGACTELDPPSDETRLIRLAASIPERLVFALRLADNGGSLSAWTNASARGRPERVWQVATPRGVALAHDTASTRVFLIRSSEHGPQGVELGHTPPALEHGGLLGELPRVRNEWWCRKSGEKDRTLLETLRKTQSDDEQLQWVSANYDAIASAPEHVAELAHDAGIYSLNAAREELLSRGLSSHPACAALVTERAGAIVRTDPARALAVLERAERGTVHDVHLDHLRAISLTLLGRGAEARPLFERVAAEDGPCRAEGWREWLDAIDGRGEPGQRATVVRELLDEARRHEQAGELTRALETLDVTAIWGDMEEQLAARLASLVLDGAKVSPFRRRLILAALLDQRKFTLRAQAPIDARLDDAALDELIARAQEALVGR